MQVAPPSALVGLALQQFAGWQAAMRLAEGGAHMKEDVVQAWKRRHCLFDHTEAA